ncbi:hypothetical protein QYE76_067893 [Lolium multiflorum]|uniref:Uncharacterized protein n=1 Tax=Lolium multiflorum TaxID=4521 RepID=A0AAD8WBE5_LOLMU|nr:hypothetical protein QYE76_067893 [Lolium multiflorum]
MSTSTELVQGMALFCSTMHDAWTTLASSFASVSSSRYMQLRRQLSEVKKLDSSATTYFNKVKNMSDTLTSIWQPLRQEEFISYLLAGLDDEYDALVDRIGARTTPIPIRDLFAQLLSTEQRIEARKASLHSGAGNYTANASTYGNRGGGGKPNYRGGGGDYRGDPQNQSRPVYTNKSSPGPTGGYPGNNYGGGSTRPPMPRGGDRDMVNAGRTGGGVNDNRPICQICDKVGHIASRCFKRFKQEYLGVDNDGRHMDRQVDVATTHGGHDGPGNGHTTFYPVDAGWWYMDTGATDYLTNELDKLTVKENYRGTDQVHAANGIGRGACLELLSPGDQADYIDLHGRALSITPLHAGPGALGVSGPDPVPSATSPGEEASPVASPVHHSHLAEDPLSAQLRPIQPRRLDFSSSSVTPTSTSPVAPPPEPTRAITCLQHGIRQAKHRTDGTVAWIAACMAHARCRASSEHADLRDALATPHWRASMEAEYSALILNGTWQLVPPRPAFSDADWACNIDDR